MKKIILLILSVSVLSCTSDDSKTNDENSIAGNWKWTKTGGGINGDVNQTPETTNKTYQLNLKSDSTYSILKNGNQISKGFYNLEMKKSIYSGEMENFITYSKDKHLENIVISGIINVSESNKLTISDNNYDGIGSDYDRVQ